MKTTLAILILATLLLGACAIPPSPAVQAHAQQSANMRAMGISQKQSNDFWK